MIRQICGYIWLIINGLLVFIPVWIPVPICIACSGGLNDPNFIGVPALTVLGLVSIALGAYGLYDLVTVKQSVPQGN